jgi:hypothetical protein
VFQSTSLSEQRVTQRSGNIRLALAYILLSVYAFGGAMVEAFVYYPAWKLVGAAEFGAFHRDMGSRLVPAFVAPFFLSIVLNLLLVRLRPSTLSTGIVLAALALNLVILVTTIGWAIPIQNQLSQAQSLAAIDRLIGLDRTFRMLPGVLLEAVNVAMLFRLVTGKP